MKLRQAHGCQPDVSTFGRTFFNKILEQYMNNINPSRLFNACCFALVTTAFAFAIRAGILGKLATDFALTDTQLGYINQMAILGFPIATIVGGWLYNEFGAKRMIWLALASHLLGILLTIFSNGFELLLLSNFFIGFGNGTVEAACNPMVAAMYRNNKTTMLNRFHVWFPGGIFLGALISKFMTDAGMGWQAQIGVMLIPTVIYAYLFWGQKFPEAEEAGQAKLSDNLAGMLNPLYFFMLFCMILTANTELSTQQWVERLLGSAGASPMLILAMVTGLMAVGRYFAGPVIHRLNPTGVLWGSAIVATLGIWMMSWATGGMIYVAAIMFAIGVCYFWPTMIGFAGEYIPRSGALGMSLMGGMGMFATGIAQPIVGGWLDSARAKATLSGLTGDAAELAAGQATLTNLLTFPIILVVAFGALWFYMRKRMAQQHHD
jgi:MFS family permease